MKGKGFFNTGSNVLDQFGQALNLADKLTNILGKKGNPF